MKLFNNNRFLKPFQFDYRPRYWDPEKEALEKKIKKGKKRADTANDPEKSAERISEAFRSGQVRRREYGKLRQAQARRSTMRVFLIIGILALLAYWLILKNMDTLLKLF